MSDLVTNLLTQYYGLGAESSGKKFLSIHQSVENAKKEEEKQVTEEDSLSTSEANPSEEEFKKENDDYRKLSAASESYPRSSRVLEDTEEAHDFPENLDSFDIDLGPNIMCDFVKDTEQIMINQRSSNVPGGGVKSTLETPEGNGSEMANGSDLSLTFVQDDSPESASVVSSTILKKSQKSSKTSTPLPPMPRKRPVYNDTFADLSNTKLEQFPSEILERFSGLKMLYLADNRLTELPNELFSSLRDLEWLDVRSNQLSSLPSSMESHPSLQTLLLQGNKIEKLPLELCTLAKLKTLQVTRNPLTTPPRDIVAAGYSAILEFLRTEWNVVHPERQVEFKQNKIEPKLSTILCYQSPRRKKRNAVSKNTVRDRNTSNTEKRKSYRPSNRYYDEKLSSLTNNTNHLFKKESTFLCDSCLGKLTSTNACENSKNTCGTLKHIVNSKNSKIKINIHLDDELKEINNKILRLLGPSPRSPYVRQNVKILRTYRKSTRTECRPVSTSDKLDCFVPPKMQNSFSRLKTGRERDNVEKIEQVFDIITKDGKLLKLHPLRLTNSEWMLSCLENCVGINN